MKDHLEIYDTNRATGLCTTCDHAPTCFLRRGAPAPIWRCEEFDDRASAPPPAPLAMAIAGSYSAPLAASLRGICGNCALRSTCTLPRPASGVWWCEEYA